MDRISPWERELWAAWAERFRRPPARAYERVARSGLASVGTPIRERDLLRALRSARLTVFGDDRLVPDDEEKILELCSVFEAGRQVSFVTGRSRGSAVAYARKRGWRIVTFEESGSYEGTDREISRSVRRCASSNRVVVWTGALRLSPSRLPERLGGGAGDAVFCCLEGAETRWESGRMEGWVRIPAGVHVFVERSPFLSLECFRAWSARSAPLLRAGDLREGFRESLAVVCASLGGRRPPPPGALLSPFDRSVFEVLSDRRRNGQVKRFLWDRLRQGESCVLPGQDMVLLSTLDPGHVAEEAAHYARLRNVPARGFGACRMALEEALAFMASTWVDPLRMKPIRQREGGSEWEGIHRFGYRLGLRLARRWRESEGNRAALRRIWKEIPGDERQARALLELLRSLA